MQPHATEPALTGEGPYQRLDIQVVQTTCAIGHSSSNNSVIKAIDGMHTGEQYHHVIQSSPRDRTVRNQFQKIALDLLPEGADVLDFGAGTGIDARVFATQGHRTFVYEPSEAMRGYLLQHCRDEIAGERIVPLASPLSCKVAGVTANFAVLNHFEDHTALFQELSGVVHKGGFVLASMLSPYYLGDARYGWWRKNLANLIRHGRYGIASESRIHRFTPQVVAQAAAPHFKLERVTPRGLGLATNLYMFLLFRRL
ncbi:MAG TPA: methyltransferase domain-containing protein [Candidatus Saccharimonadales bacterium]|nr:methyltransferase domain-containing protein [Candidatus Saccharimonadales bacterium]